MRSAFAEAHHILTSDLTLIECDRALVRAQVSLGLPEAEIVRRHRLLEAAVAHWTLLRITPAIVARARRPFPRGPIRTLDALHLASALEAAVASADLAMLSLDRRVRGSASGLGLSVTPAV